MTGLRLEGSHEQAGVTLSSTDHHRSASPFHYGFLALLLLAGSPGGAATMLGDQAVKTVTPTANARPRPAVGR
jgi:hypothetical protein